jgi:hypothetical protein
MVVMVVVINETGAKVISMVYMQFEAIIIIRQVASDFIKYNFCLKNLHVTK